MSENGIKQEQHKIMTKQLKQAALQSVVSYAGKFDPRVKSLRYIDILAFIFSDLQRLSKISDHFRGRYVSINSVKEEFYSDNPYLADCARGLLRAVTILQSQDLNAEYLEHLAGISNIKRHYDNKEAFIVKDVDSLYRWDSDKPMLNGITNRSTCNGLKRIIDLRIDMQTRVDRKVAYHVGINESLCTFKKHNLYSNYEFVQRFLDGKNHEDEMPLRYSMKNYKNLLTANNIYYYVGFRRELETKDTNSSKMSDEQIIEYIQQKMTDSPKELIYTYSLLWGKRMIDLIDHYFDEFYKIKNPTLIDICDLIQKLHLIHPFYDGNGRVICINLLNALLLHYGYPFSLQFDTGYAVGLSLKEYARSVAFGCIAMGLLYSAQKHLSPQQVEDYIKLVCYISDVSPRGKVLYNSSFMQRIAIIPSTFIAARAMLPNRLKNLDLEDPLEDVERFRIKPTKLEVSVPKILCTKYSTSDCYYDTRNNPLKNTENTDKKRQKNFLMAKTLCGPTNRSIKKRY